MTGLPGNGAIGPGHDPVAAGLASRPALPDAGWDALAADDRWSGSGRSRPMTKSR